MVDVSSGRKAPYNKGRGSGLLPDFEKIREQTRAERDARTKARTDRTKAREKAAATKAAAKATPKPKALPPQYYEKPGNRPTRAPGVPGRNAVAAATPAGASTTQASSQSIPGQARSGFGAPATSSHGGGTSSLVPASASRNQGVAPPMTITPTPAVASAFRKGQAVGARKVAAKATKKAADTAVKGFTPSPSGLKRPGLLERNKANIQAKALERMKKSGRKG